METLMGSDSVGGPVSFSSSSSESSTTSSSSCSNCQQSNSINISSDDGLLSTRRESESYVAVKGQSLIVTKSEGQKRGLCRRPSAVTLNGSPPQSCKVVDSPEELVSGGPSAIISGSPETQTMSEIERHLHLMTQLLRQEDSIKLVVKLESVFGSRIRYLAVLSCMEQESEEYCLLGIDCQGHITLGLVLPILSHTTIRLDGDGGFCITDGDGLRSHIFKPVSVQTMWSALQSLYGASECAKKNNSFQVCAFKHYESLFQANKSDPGCLNEWNTLPGVETKRPVNSTMSSDELSFQEKISSSLREILLSEKDLDEVTSKEIRTKLEHKLQVDLSHYKSFIDEEMLKILGQMEAPAMILDHLYLGTEWNASHQQDLIDKEIGYILNVTAEIDNFFPDTFRYMNIPVNDNEETDLLRYFNDSYRFISDALKEGKNVLVHCKMGISRSATIVIAYVMKNRNWDLVRSIDHVKNRRTCVKPNPNFMKQLEVYEGILTAKRFSNTLEKRSKSESNLKQSDLSLSTPKDVNLSSSNNNVSHDTTLKKSPRKYYNTAPARLKPEKQPKITISLSKPKSCSCAAIAMTNERKARSRIDDMVPKDVMNRFRDAVESLEQNSYTSPSSSPRNTANLIINHNESRFPSFFKNYDSSSGSSSLTLPTVTLNTEPSTNYISTETVFLSTSTKDKESLESTKDEDLNIWTPPPLDNNITHEVNRDSLSECLSVPNSIELSNDLSFEDFDAKCSDKERTSKKSNLKCCRRPLNGHTFIFSPNQVLNISSVVDLSKFSVRHLVNEFEQQNNRNSQGSFAGTTSETSIGFPSSVAIFDPSTYTVTKNNTRRKSWNPFDSNKEYSSSADEQETINSEIKESLQEKLSQSLDEQTLVSIATTEEKQFRSIHNFADEKAAKKDSKTGCVPFLRRRFPSSGHKNHSSTPTDKEMATSTIGKLLRSTTKKSADSGRSRDKVKDRSVRNNPKSLEQTIPSENRSRTELVEGYGSEENNANFSPAVYQSTGVVKLRLEVFEAKSVPASEQKSNNRSHNRSYSATGPTSSSLLSPFDHNDKCSYGHRRKSSMPQLNSGTLEFETQSGPTQHVPLAHLSERKGSLDSNTLLKSLPNVNNRPFTVRGFQSPSISTSKSLFSNSKIRGNHIGFNTSAATGARQQHGSTHPLKLLPKTTKLT